MSAEMHGSALIGENPAAAIYNRAVDLKHLTPGQVVLAPRPALNTIQMWLGGEWMLRRDGKAIPVVGPVPDGEKDPQHNAIYEDTSKPKGKRHWFSDDPIAYGHRPMSETVGAVVSPAVLEFLKAKQMQVMTEDLYKVEDPIKRDEAIAKKLAQIDAANPPGQSWDGKTPIVARSVEDDLRAEINALRLQLAMQSTPKTDSVLADAFRGTPAAQPTEVEEQLKETSPDNPEPPKRRGRSAK